MYLLTVIIWNEVIDSFKACVFYVVIRFEPQPEVLGCRVYDWWKCSATKSTNQRRVSVWSITNLQKVILTAFGFLNME